MSVREHLEQVEQSTGRRPADLDGPEMPEVLEHVWRDFIALHNRRGSGMDGAHPLTYESIFAWCNLYKLRLSCWELEIIEALDVAWRRVAQERKDG